MLQRLLIKIYGENWKTSLNGDLAAIIWICTIVSGFVLKCNCPTWVLAIPGTAGSVAAFLRLLVGRLQED